MKKIYHIYTLIALTFGAYNMSFAQCDDGAHSINWEDNWVSCQLSDNPNPERAESHWIMYDLGVVHELYASHIWNLNASGETGKGIRNCWFDVSLDGVEWEEAAMMEIPEAPGTSDYIGVNGPDFYGIEGRYLLITVQNNWDGDACSGFSEIKVNSNTSPTDIEDFASHLELGLYPNPASNQLTIRNYSNGTLGIEIFDSSGRMVLREQISGSSQNFDVSALAEGLYVLKANSSGKIASKNFVVMR